MRQLGVWVLCLVLCLALKPMAAEAVLTQYDFSGTLATGAQVTATWTADIEGLPLLVNPYHFGDPSATYAVESHFTIEAVTSIGVDFPGLTGSFNELCVGDCMFAADPGIFLRVKDFVTPTSVTFQLGFTPDWTYWENATMYRPNGWLIGFQRETPTTLTQTAVPEPNMVWPLLAILVAVCFVCQYNAVRQ